MPADPHRDDDEDGGCSGGGGGPGSLVREARDLDVAELVAALTALGLTVATAESLTAGQVSAALADVPGASAVLRGGVSAYATDVKADVLGVPAGVLADGGPVQERVAAAMATGAAALLRADLAVATTGVAGPGPADGHPPGTVVLAVAGPVPRRAAAVVTVALPGERSDVRALATRCALALLARVVRERRAAPGR